MWTDSTEARHFLLSRASLNQPGIGKTASEQEAKKQDLFELLSAQDIELEEHCQAVSKLEIQSTTDVLADTSITQDVLGILEREIQYFSRKALILQEVNCMGDLGVLTLLNGMVATTRQSLNRLHLLRSSIKKRRDVFACYEKENIIPTGS